jgi:hypothetical protein
VTRAYDEFLADIFDLLSPTWVALILLAVAVAVGLLWYTYPAWLRLRLRLPRPRWKRPHWRWPKWKLPKWKWRRPRFKRKPRKKTAKRQPRVSPSAPEPDHEPQPVPTAPLSAADRLAAEGRYAEAIRERLRESVTTLTSHGVIAPAPAWTAHELTTRASANRPTVATPLAGARRPRPRCSRRWRSGR